MSAMAGSDPARIAATCNVAPSRRFAASSTCTSGQMDRPHGGRSCPHNAAPPQVRTQRQIPWTNFSTAIERF